MLDVKEAAAKARPTGEKKQRGCNSQAEERQGQSISGSLTFSKGKAFYGTKLSLKYRSTKSNP